MNSKPNKYFLFGIVLLISGTSFGQKVTTSPTFHINFSGKSSLSTPTADKPQSKLWYMDSCWWALLPDSLGPVLWQRTDKGWKEHPEVGRKLRGIPGRADVWYENRTVTAVGVSDSSLYVFRIVPRKFSAVWRTRFLKRLKMPLKEVKIETATIVRDGAGVWWVAAGAGNGTMYVWSSKDATHWSKGMLIGDQASADDICSIAVLKQSVIVIWSDQKHESVYCREHLNGRPPEDWTDVQAIEAGNETADDHINIAVSGDGTLWAATKNSLDKVGYPQLVMRVRDPRGNWKNFPYLDLTHDTGPSRPVVITTPDPALLLEGHTVYDYRNKKRYADRITFGIIDTTSEEILVKRVDVIVPDTSLQIMINNITAPRAAFPSDGPWIILASDSRGNVYEADLRPFFDKTKP